jgi:hypothetical protein
MLSTRVTRFTGRLPLEPTPYVNNGEEDENVEAEELIPFTCNSADKAYSINMEFMRDSRKNKLVLSTRSISEFDHSNSKSRQFTPADIDVHLKLIAAMSKIQGQCRDWNWYCSAKTD